MTWTASPSSTARFHAPARTAPHAGVRLTRRGRVVVLLALLGLVLMAFTLGRGATSQAAGSPGSQAADAPAATRAATVTPYAQTTVHEGESLWAVAKRVAPNHDPRAVVQEIRELNDLDSAAVGAVHVGQLLLLPRNA